MAWPEVQRDDYSLCPGRIEATRQPHHLPSKKTSISLISGYAGLPGEVFFCAASLCFACACCHTNRLPVTGNSLDTARDGLASFCTSFVVFQ